MNPILECKGLTRKFNHFFALSNVDLTLERGEIIGLLGPNGSGKTTLIKLINGLLLPTDGQITVNGSVPGVETKKIVSYLPERGCLDERRRISELISYYSDFYSDFDVSRAHTMLKDLDIDPSLRLKTLSKGTKEKVRCCIWFCPVIMRRQFFRYRSLCFWKNWRKCFSMERSTRKAGFFWWMMEAGIVPGN